MCGSFTVCEFHFPILNSADLCLPTFLLKDIFLRKQQQGRSHWRGRGQGRHGPFTSISEANKVQEFKFQISGTLLFMGVQKLYGPEISRFLPCMLQFLDNLRRLFIFSKYIRGIDHFTLDLLTFDFLKYFTLWAIRKKKERDFKESTLDFRRNPGPTEKVF